MLKKKVINGVEYMRISDIAEISEVPIRTLQRWLNNGELVNFITTYQTKTGMHYYRLGLPNPDDELVEGSTIKYKMKTEDKT